MHRSKAVMLGLMVLSGATMAQAQETPVESVVSLGISSYATTLAVTNSRYGNYDWSFSGAALNATLAVDNNLAVRGNIYSQTWDDDTNVELAGFDIQFLLGENLIREGFKYYLAVGFFSEELSAYQSTNAYSLSGAMAGFGLGYNWERAAVDFTLNIRNAQPYVDMFEEMNMPGGGTVSASSMALSLAYRL